VERISGPEKFGSSAKKDFFNTIRAFQTQRIELMTSALKGKADLLGRSGHFCF
jgi:hypothetical protein